MGVPHYTSDLTRSPSGSMTIYMAMRIALAFSHRTPLPSELEEKYGMSRANAYRWVRAMKDAKAQP